MSGLKLPEGPISLPARMTDEWLEQYRENRWLNLGDTSRIELANPFFLRTKDEIENPHVHLLDLMRKPENFGYTVKVLFDKQLLPFQIAVLRELWTRPFPMLIGCRGIGKSFILAVYVMLRLLFNQGSKIVICGAAFRQAKVVFDYCQEMWENGPVYRDIVGPDGRNGPRRDVDRCYMRVGDSIATALPLGNGEKIRGQRANIIIADEFASISQEIFETVIRGFAAVSLSPAEKYKSEMRKRALKELNLWTPAHEEIESGQLVSNQTIISGTAYYSFNYFFDYWKQYKAFVESKGDQRKLEEAFNGKVPEKFNWKDYSVIRIPVSAAPSGFMDEKQIAQAKATVHVGTFNMEYGACHHPSTNIITSYGVKSIVDIVPGDMVLTHRGRFRPVTGVTTRNVDGGAVSWTTRDCTHATITTAEHPFWTGGESWSQLDQIGDRVMLSRLRELSGETQLDIRKWVGDYMEAGDKIYPRHSQSKLSREQVAEIRTSGLSQSELARKYGVSVGAIHLAIRRQRTPKTAIPAVIPLSYELGLILGYYASEGSVGANGRSVGFALDGHVGTGLEKYVNQLTEAIKAVFGIAPKVYRRADNVATVTVNQRLFADFLKTACPGVSHTKTVRPEIIYANEEVLRGFIVGYWNGDGHLSRAGNAGLATATCVNIGLLSQVRVALSYFGIPASIYERKNLGTATFRGKSYPTRRTFTLAMCGESRREFGRTFYGESSEAKSGRREVTVDRDAFILPAQLSDSDYVGPVYNLHVAEDESYSLLNATVHNCFVSDSNGFFRRSLIESCVVGKKESPVHIPTYGEVKFSAVLRGQPGPYYVMGIDPASENDNFSVVILECHGNHRRIVFCWTTTRARYKAKAKRGLADGGDFYAYTARKIRELMGLFSVERIAMDTQGGGYAVMEALQDPANMREQEVPLYPVIDPDGPKETDHLVGNHIIEMVQFSKAEWVSNANHGLRKDFEDKVLLFPYFDPAIVALAHEEDKDAHRVVVDNKDMSVEKLYDTLEDCVLEIEVLKDELATIVHTQTGTSMRDRWDTPETKLAGGKKGRLRKDRYSALLMANMSARTIQRTPKEPEFKALGGFAHQMSASSKDGPLYTGPAWWGRAGGSGGYGAVVKRR